MLEREQMSVEILQVRLNLVGFNPDFSDKMTKQIEAINRMNTTQHRLKYRWDVSDDVYKCHAHFIITSPLPSYLENSNAPILSNQNFDAANLIPCPYPVTTFDLIDILAYAESTLPEYNLDSLFPTKAQHLDSTSNSNVQDKSGFQTYGSFGQHSSDDTESTEEPISIFEQAAKKWLNQNNTDTSKTTTENKPSAPLQTRDSVNATPKQDEFPETFIRYGSLKQNSDHQNTTIQKSTPKPTSAPAIEQALSEPDFTKDLTAQIPENVKSDASVTQQVDEAASNVKESNAKDVWGELARYQTGIVAIESLNIYVDYNQRVIASKHTTIEQLVQNLMSAAKNDAKIVPTMASGLKEFSLNSALWSYALHTKHLDTLVAHLDIEGHQWKLKGFPRFGQWETNPTWLFLATFFAQSPQTLYSALSKGKANERQIKHFIYAASLAGLTWQTEVLSEQQKQQLLAQQTQQQAPEKASWITRLRQKLNINEHFTSSLD